MVEVEFPEYMGYDRTIAVFTPDGRILQVEYAKEAVKRGATSLGMIFKDGVLLASVRIRNSRLMVPSIEKLFQIDDHAGAVASGFLADARVLIQMARVRAQMHKITYEEPEDIWSIARTLADRIQYSTLIAGLRPFGVGILIGGVDLTGSHIVEVDTAGMIFEWKAHSIGRGSVNAIKILQQKWSEDLSEEEAVKLAWEIFEKTEKGFKEVDIAIIKGSEKYKVLSDEEIKKIVS